MFIDRLRVKESDPASLSLGELAKELHRIGQEIGYAALLGEIFERYRDKKEIEPQPLNLEELASELRFTQDLTLQGIEYFILHTERTEDEMVILFRGYTQNAQIMLDKKEAETGKRRTDKDSLALMLKLAHLRQQTGRYRQLFDDFEDIRDCFYSPDIEPALADRVEESIETAVKEVGKQIIAQTPVDVLKEVLEEFLSKDHQIQKLYLLAQAEGRD